MTDNVKAFITLLGNPIVATVKEETSEHYVLEGAVQLIANQDPNTKKVVLDYAPISFPFAAGDPNKGLDFTLDKRQVIIAHDIEEVYKNRYMQLLGKVKIEIAPAAAIVQLDSIRKNKKD